MGSIALPLTGHIDAAGTRYVKGFDMPELIGRRIAPDLPVTKESGVHWVHGREMQENNNDDQRARGGRPNRIRIVKTTTPYRCISHALEAQIPDEDAAAYAIPGGTLSDEALETAMSQILVKHEVRLAAKLADTAVLTQNETLAGPDQWNAGGGSPITRVNAAKKAVLLGCGRRANLLIIGEDVLTELLVHDSIVERLKFVQKGGTARNDLGSVFFPDGDGRVEIGSGVVVDRTGAVSFAWGKHVIAAYVSPAAGVRDPSAFRTFVWSNAPGTSGGMGVISQRDPYEAAKADLRSVDWYYDENNFVVNALAAYLIKNAVA